MSVVPFRHLLFDPRYIPILSPCICDDVVLFLRVLANDSIVDDPSFVVQKNGESGMEGREGVEGSWSEVFHELRGSGSFDTAGQAKLDESSR